MAVQGEPDRKSMPNMEYEKTQRGGLHHILHIAAAAMLLGAWFARAETPVTAILIGAAGLLAVLSLMFATLTVRDEGDWLALRYGPMPGFRKRIRYAEITSVEPSRTSIIDGWGIHYIPGRGMTYNLWGFGCVKLTLGRKVIRIGSDDVDNLAAFLRRKITVPGPDILH